MAPMNITTDVTSHLPALRTLFARAGEEEFVALPSPDYALVLRQVCQEQWVAELEAYQFFHRSWSTAASDVRRMEKSAKASEVQREAARGKEAAALVQLEAQLQVLLQRRALEEVTRTLPEALSGDEAAIFFMGYSIERALTYMPQA